MKFKPKTLWRISSQLSLFLRQFTINNIESIWRKFTKSFIVEVILISATNQTKWHFIIKFHFFSLRKSGSNLFLVQRDTHQKSKAITKHYSFFLVQRKNLAENCGYFNETFTTFSPYRFSFIDFGIVFSWNKAKVSNWLKILLKTKFWQNSA